MRRFLLGSSALVLLVSHSFAADAAIDRMPALQTLGVRIKIASDQADAGSLPSSTLLAQFEHALAEFRDPSRAASSPQLERKHQAVERLLAKLKYQAIQSPPTPAATSKIANAGSASRARIDVELVNPGHGDGCAAALGISEHLPVKVSLAQSSSERGAWLRFEPSAPGHIRVSTHSSGADPAIEIFRDCSAGAKAIAANDDDLGLDAAAMVVVVDRSPLSVHVTNSGQAGPAVIEVATTDGTVSGTITDAITGNPVNGVQVSLFTSSGNYYAGSDYTDQSGSYSIFVSPGSYYAKATSSDYVSLLFPNAPCYPGYYYNGTTGCAVAQAQAVTVDDGATVANIDFALNRGQRILGQLRDTSNQPITGQVNLFDSSGVQLFYSYTDSVGHYSFVTLPPGAYKLDAQVNGYGSQMYSHVACGGPLQTQCNLAQASSVAISNQDALGVNFDLPLLATIQGTISGSNSQPLSYGTSVNVLDANGNSLTSAYVDGNGNYKAGPLAPGSYYIYAGSYGYFSQIFDGHDCTHDCTLSVADATPITISQAGQQAQASFVLNPLPAVHGHVQDASSALAIADVSIVVSITPPSSFSQAGAATTDSNGDYVLQNVPAGTYYVWALSDDHLDQIYAGVPCEAIGPYYYNQNTPCDVSGATLLIIAPGQTPPTVNFTLNRSSTISGNAIARAGQGSDLPASSEISVYNGAGVEIGSANTDALGHYAIGDLPANTYFAAAGSYYYYSDYIEQLWHLIDCPSTCAVTTGTPVNVGAGATIPGIDFALTRRNAIVGRVTSVIGAPISGALVDLFNSINGTYAGSGVSDVQGYYAAVGNIGNSYFVATDSGSGYVDQVYLGISCPQGPAYFGLCAFANATVANLSNTSTQPSIVNFVLKGDKIFSAGFE